MRTLVLIVVGLAAAVAVARLAPPARRIVAVAAFTVVWLLVTLWNLDTGLSHGYSVGEELPIQAVIFAVPVAVAWLLVRIDGARRPGAST